MSYLKVVIPKPYKRLDRVSKYAFSGLLIGFIVLAIGSFAQMVSAQNMENMLFEGAINPSLSNQEQLALKIAKDWQSGKADKSIKPIKGSDGTINFVYGANQTPIVCAPMQICDVALQDGELVNTINLGDSSRWIVEPAITGEGANQITHLIIKPLDVGLTTSLMVATNRRSYHLQLKSHRTQYMPKVAFMYPADALAKWTAIKQNQDLQQAQINASNELKRQDFTIKKTGEYLGDLDFNYKITGKADFKPIRVYNDGVKTILEMPKTMPQDDAPSIMVINKEGGLFTSEQTKAVVYRVHGTRFVVDGVFRQMILVTGVGRNQKRITITRK